MLTTYILNRKSRVMHLALDGKTNEQCNIDQIKDKAMFYVKPTETKVILCRRCFYNEVS